MQKESTLMFPWPVNSIISVNKRAPLKQCVLPSAAGDGDGDGERVTVRTGHGHGYSSSHSSGHPSGGTPEQGGAGVVDPRNLNARSHHRRGAATRATAYSSWLVCTLVAGGVMLLLLL